MNILRIFFMLPLTIPTVVAGVLMTYLFSASGWVNRILMELSLTTAPVHWTSGGVESLAMIILAGLKSIDRELYQAATVDGASGFYVFQRITLPLLMPSITAAVIICGIDAFRIFELPLILMGQNFKVIGTYSYLEYMDYQNVHLSAASAVVLFIIIMLAVIV